MNKLQLEKDIAEMKARLASMEAELAKPVKSNVYVPAKGETYCVIGTDGMIYDFRWTNDSIDKLRLAHRNCYETKEAAEKARDKQLAPVRVLNKLRDLEGDWVADWDEPNQEKYSICFSHPIKKFSAERWQTRQCSSKELYSTREAWQWVINNMDADLRLMLEVE